MRLSIRILLIIMLALRVKAVARQMALLHFTSYSEGYTFPEFQAFDRPSINCSHWQLFTSAFTGFDLLVCIDLADSGHRST